MFFFSVFSPRFVCFILTLRGCEKVAFAIPAISCQLFGGLFSGLCFGCNFVFFSVHKGLSLVAIVVASLFRVGIGRTNAQSAVRYFSSYQFQV